jgi:hypothetical protein
MKCETARAWLLSNESPGILPGPIARHLQHCAACAAVQARLLELESELGRLPEPPDCDAAQLRFLEHFQQAVKAAPGRVRKPAEVPAALHRKPLVFAALATAAVFAAGWFASRWWLAGPHAPGAIAQPDVAPQAIAQPSGGEASVDGPSPPHVALPRVDYALLPALVENHARLAAAESLVARCALLSEQAQLLWQVAAQQARASPTADLWLLRDTYGHLVADALPRLAAALPAEETDLRDQLVRTLRGHEDEAARAAQQAAPAVGVLLAAFGDCAGRGAAQLQMPTARLDAQPAQRDTEARFPVALVVHRSVQSAEEDDPLRRATLSCDVAEQMAEVLVFLSLSGQSDVAQQLGASLDLLIEQGIETTVVRWAGADPDDPRRPQWQEVQRRCQHARQVLQRNLDHVPAAARGGLLRALEAQSRGRGRLEGRPGAGPHQPPGLRPDFVPRGRQK